MDSEIWKKLAVIGLSLSALFLVGTAGYTWIEGWPWFDSLYMTAITLTTVGYGEVHPLSTPGRAFTIVLALLGLGVVAYSVSVLTAFIVEGELTDVLRRRKMTARIEALKDHYIVCGGGNTGRTILAELSHTRRPFVVIDRDEEKVKRLREAGHLAVQGDSLKDEALEQAGIARAAGLFCALASDRDNVFVAITARGMNPRLRIVSELHDEHVRGQLLRGGADSAVSSAFIGGLRMVSEMVRPAAVGFLDSMIRDKDSAYRFEEIAIPAGSSLVGRPAGEVKGAQGDAALLLAIKQAQGAGYEINPRPERKLSAGEVLVVLGSSEEVGRLKEHIGN